jgi:hypothetical protein
LKALIEALNDMKLKLADAADQLAKAQAGREALQAELGKQSSAAFLDECDNTIRQKESVIVDLRNQLNFTDQKCFEFQNEINTLKCYIIDLKQMIQMLLNPDNVSSMKPQQQAEIALTAYDQHLESYSQVNNVMGNPTRFFSGKVVVTKDVKESTSPVRYTYDGNRSKSPAGMSAQNMAIRSSQQVSTRRAD